MKIEIYSTPACSYCRKAKILLDSLDIEYTEYNVYADNDAMAVMREGGYKTVPQIFIDDVHVGGYDDLLEMHEGGALKEGHTRLGSNQE